MNSKYLRNTSNDVKIGILAAKNFYTALKNLDSIVFIDEVQFFSSTVPMKEWTCRRTNISISTKHFAMTPVRMFMAIDSERGVLCKLLMRENFNSHHMIRFLNVLSNVTNRRTWVFMDNAPYHKSKAITTAMKKLRLLPIFNKPCNPDYNPIESVFGVLKTNFRKIKLRAIADGEELQPETLVNRATNMLSNLGVRKTVMKVLKMWQSTPEWAEMLRRINGK